MLEGKTVRLRPVELDDLERDLRWVNDREVTQYLTIRYPMSRRDEERWLTVAPENGMAAGVRFAIETKDGTHIGNLDLHMVRPEDGCAMLGIMIGEKACWSNGFGGDAIRTLLRFAFDEMGLHRVALHVFEFNERGIACYKKCGMRVEARLRDHVYTKGRYWDVVVMGVLADEFRALLDSAAPAEVTP